MDFLLFYFDSIGQKYYHARLMSARAVIDSLEFAVTGGQLHGEAPVAQFERLCRQPVRCHGQAKISADWRLDARRRPRLQLSVEGVINLRCQRCLGSLIYPVAVESSLLVLAGKTGGGETAEIDDLDGIPADSHTDVWGLVEDEVLLAIPIAPRHAEGQCNAAMDSAPQRAASPFAVLARLKQDRIQN